MAVQNVRLQAIYNGFRIGWNSVDSALGSSRPYFIDSSRNPIVMERKGGRFRFACEVVVNAAPQASFRGACAALEAAFDPTQSPNGSLRIESDNQVYEDFDRVASSFAAIVNFNNLAGKTFTLTINGTLVFLFRVGIEFTPAASNKVTANLLAVAINNSGAGAYVTASSAFNDENEVIGIARLQTKNNVFSVSFTSDASINDAQAGTNVGPTGFNAVPSISKIGSKVDTALSRRYAIEVSLDLPAKEVNKNGRFATRIDIFETDPRRKKLVVSGAYSALTNKSALQQYDAQIDAFALTVQQALGGTWEGPFDVVERPDTEYLFATDGTRGLGSIMRFSRTYEQLIYNQSKGTLDDVRLRRQVLKVRPSTEAPGDYGPGGRAVYRLRRVTITYSAAVDMTVTQDLKGVYETVVKPFLIDEAKKAVGSSQIALTFQEPELDRAENRISASVEVLAASSGTLVASTVTTQDEDEQGKYLVAVWNGDRLAKIEYDGPQTIRRTVTQRYTVIGPPSGSAAGGVGGGAKDQFGVFNVNQPQGFSITIQESSGVEAAIDNFFGIPSSSRSGGSGGDAAFATSGGVPEPAGARPVYRNGVVLIEPVILGRPGDPQITLTKITKTKVYEYIHDPSRPKGGPGKDITQAFNGGKSDAPGGDLKTVSR